MKFLVIFACVLVAVYGVAPEIEEMIKQDIITKAGQCKEEIGASDDDIAPMKAHEAPTSPKGKCFAACMAKKCGFQDASGKIDKPATYAKVEKMKSLDADMYEKMKKVADTCLAEVTDQADECETAAVMFGCVQREKKVVGIKPIEF